MLRIQREWQFRDARARLRSVIYEAMASGPQRITRYGEPAVVVLSESDFQLLNSTKAEPLEDFTMHPGFVEAELDHDLTIGQDIAP